MTTHAKREKIAAVRGFRSMETQPAVRSSAVPTESTQQQLHGLVINVAWVTFHVLGNAGTLPNLLRHVHPPAMIQALFV